MAQRGIQSGVRISKAAQLSKNGPNILESTGHVPGAGELLILRILLDDAKVSMCFWPSMLCKVCGIASTDEAAGVFQSFAKASSQ